ncbi:MaoC family dehydratase [Candidimonas nitroreducens]|uniref:Dehydratase n=1 Tax=Candidimonas nitroreducens TaxID=683354 RepID=A0A225MCU4_9BURK|nr:MaoC family dehydratase [Candidimonas nitroreducens]OWT59114.1 dehydratase [Candidimonas nitroreducens]
MTSDEIKQFPVAGKGHYFEDFTPGRVFEHARGRTLLAADNQLYSALTVQMNPLYVDRLAAKAVGHPDMPIQPYLVFATVFGLTVEDLSENGGAFLGVDNLSFERPVYPGATLRARSTVQGKRPSAKNPGFGIVTWFTEGFDPESGRVLTFMRTNMVRARAEVAA